jgi:ribonuclease-3 family protein
MIKRLGRDQPVHAEALSPAALALIGDAVYALFVRTRLATTGPARQQELHELAARRLCAAAQARALELLEGRLTPEELAVARRARNAKLGKGGGGTPAERHMATAFEALLGHLYLTGRLDRLDELLVSVAEQPFPNSGGDRDVGGAPEAHA